jgi:hypothetical protein
MRFTIKKHHGGTKKRTMKFKKLKCGPSSRGDSRGDSRGASRGASRSKKYTCYTNKSLQKLKFFWNKRHPDQRIQTNNSKQIWEQLKYYMMNTCSTERCWLNQQFIKFNLDKKLKKNTFAPKSPKSWLKNPKEWLSSVDLMKVMGQYEHTYKNFMFIGPSPIDYDTRKMFGTCVWEDLCNFNLSEYIKKKKDKIGIIFNMDPHYKGGSHWVCVFVDLKKKFIFYFDSNGLKAPKQIKKCVKMIQQQSAEQLEFVQNAPKRHQQYDTECGMYVLYVISSLLTGKKTYEYFMNERIKDGEMFKLRKKFFNDFVFNT